jgi:hypothetical protein
MLEALEERFPADIAWKILSYCRHPTAELLDEPIAEWLKYKPMSYKGLLQFNHYVANKSIYNSLMKNEPKKVSMFSESVVLTALPIIVPRPCGAQCHFITFAVDGVVHEFWRYRGSDGFNHSRRFILPRPYRSI